MNILHIDSCALAEHSVARRESLALVRSFQKAEHHAKLVYRDLFASPLSHVSGPLLRVLCNEWDSSIPMNAELIAEAILNEVLMREFQQADVLVMTAPMHNLSIPSTLKVWLDRLLLTDRNCYETTKTKSNRLKKKHIIIFTTPECKMPEMASDTLMDNQESYLTMFFNMMGVSDIDIIRIEPDFDLCYLFGSAQQEQFHAA